MTKQQNESERETETKKKAKGESETRKESRKINGGTGRELWKEQSRESLNEEKKKKKAE